MYARGQNTFEQRGVLWPFHWGSRREPTVPSSVVHITRWCYCFGWSCQLVGVLCALVSAFVLDDASRNDRTKLNIFECRVSLLCVLFRVTDWLVFMSGVSVVLRVATLGRDGAIIRAPSIASPNVRVLLYSLCTPVVSGRERFSQHSAPCCRALSPVPGICDNSRHGLRPDKLPAASNGGTKNKYSS